MTYNYIRCLRAYTANQFESTITTTRSRVQLCVSVYRASTTVFSYGLGPDSKTSILAVLRAETGLEPALSESHWGMVA